jgi:hypothetical protein
LFPFFPLAGAGPPPEASGDRKTSISESMPLTHVTRALQEARRLDLGGPVGQQALPASPAAVAVAGSIALSARAEA